MSDLKNIRKVVFLIIFVAIYAALSGWIPSYISSLSESREMDKYQNYVSDFMSKGVMSDQDMISLEQREEDYLNELKSSNYAQKSFTLNYLVFPIMFIIFAYVWYVLGKFGAHENRNFKLTIFALGTALLFYFGYSYQPLLHVCAFLAGLFVFSKKYKNGEPV